MSNFLNSSILVTGAGGHLGRRVVELLLEAGAKSLIATTRNPEKLSDLAKRGVDVRKADFDDPATLDSAFAGAERMLLVSTDALHTPYLRLTQHRAAVAAAEKAGVEHVVYTSAPAPHPTPESSLIDDHFWTEVALFGSGLDWTILRNNIYAEIFLMGAAHAVESGQLVTATGTGGRSYVTREDCARTAAAALVSLSGRTVHDVSGPEAITQDVLAAMLSETVGRPIAHVAVGPEDLRSGLVGAGLPPFMVDLLVAFDVDASRGYHATIAPTVETLTDRAPTAMADFLAANGTALAA